MTLHTLRKAKTVGALFELDQLVFAEKRGHWSVVHLSTAGGDVHELLVPFTTTDLIADILEHAPRAPLCLLTKHDGSSVIVAYDRVVAGEAEDRGGTLQLHTDGGPLQTVEIEESLEVFVERVRAMHVGAEGTAAEPASGSPLARYVRVELDSRPDIIACDVDTGELFETGSESFFDEEWATTHPGIPAPGLAGLTLAEAAYGIATDSGSRRSWGPIECLAIRHPQTRCGYVETYVDGPGDTFSETASEMEPPSDRVSEVLRHYADQALEHDPDVEWDFDISE